MEESYVDDHRLPSIRGRMLPSPKGAGSLIPDSSSGLGTRLRFYGLLAGGCAAGLFVAVRLVAMMVLYVQQAGLG